MSVAVDNDNSQNVSQCASVHLEQTKAPDRRKKISQIKAELMKKLSKKRCFMIKHDDNETIERLYSVLTSSVKFGS